MLLACLQYTLLLVQADMLQDQVHRLAVDFAALNAKPEAASVHAPWQRVNRLPPLDSAALFGQEAQLSQLQELTKADGHRGLLTIWGTAGMVCLTPLACRAACQVVQCLNTDFPVCVHIMEVRNVQPGPPRLTVTMTSAIRVCCTQLCTNAVASNLNYAATGHQHTCLRMAGHA